MKTVNKSTETARNFDQLISMLLENEILNTKALIQVRGGEGEANGGGSVMIVPKKEC